MKKCSFKALLLVLIMAVSFSVAGCAMKTALTKEKLVDRMGDEGDLGLRELGLAVVKNKDFKKAEKILNARIAGEFYLLGAVLELQFDKCKEAREAYKMSLKFDPELSESKDGLQNSVICPP